MGWTPHNTYACRDLLASSGCSWFSLHYTRTSALWSVSIFAALFVTGVDYARSLAGLMDSMPGDTAQGETQDSLPSSLALLLKGAGAAAVLLLGGSILLGVKPDLFLGVVEPTVKGLMPFLE